MSYNNHQLALLARCEDELDSWRDYAIYHEISPAEYNRTMLTIHHLPSGEYERFRKAYTL